MRLSFRRLLVAAAIEPDAVWRGIEHAGDRASGVGHVVLRNESGADVLLESFRLGNGYLLSPADGARRQPMASSGRGSASDTNGPNR
jgi:hypothetical protein